MEQPAQGGLQSLWAGALVPTVGGPGRGRSKQGPGGPPEATLWPFPWPHPQASEATQVPALQEIVSSSQTPSPSGDTPQPIQILEAVFWSMCGTSPPAFISQEQRRRKKPLSLRNPDLSPQHGQRWRCRGTWLVAQADRLPLDQSGKTPPAMALKVPIPPSQIFGNLMGTLMLKGHSSIGYHQRTVLWPREHDLPIWRPCHGEADPGGGGHVEVRTT